MTVIGLMLLATFIALFQVKMRAEIAEHKYTKLDCNMLEEQYTPNQILHHSLATWHRFYEEQAGEETKISGFLNCFCTKELRQKGSGVYELRYGDTTFT